jgi:hypothetical protein
MMLDHVILCRNHAYAAQIQTGYARLLAGEEPPLMPSEAKRRCTSMAVPPSTPDERRNPPRNE